MQSCWIITDEGKTGTEHQCVGLAEAMGLVPILKRIGLRMPWRFISPYVTLGAKYAFTGAEIAPPWPDILIASGRKSVLASLYIKKASCGRTFTVQVQDPRVNTEKFDVVISPQHDELSGGNIITTIGSLHKITKEKTQKAAEEFVWLKERLGKPLIAVIIGGKSKSYKFDADTAVELSKQLIKLKDDSGAGLMITASRRTGPEAEKILREKLAELPRVFFWDGVPPNPLMAFLGLADFIIVTSDSVSMVSEACSTGKPVFVVELEGGSEKFKQFHNALYKKGLARPFAGKLESWQPPTINEMASVAEEVNQRFLRHLGKIGAYAGTEE